MQNFSLAHPGYAPPTHPAAPNAKSVSLGFFDLSIQLQHIDGEDEQVQAFPGDEALPRLLLCIDQLRQGQTIFKGEFPNIYGILISSSHATISAKSW